MSEHHKQKHQENFHSRSVDYCLERLKAVPSGLSDSEAAHRLKKYGHNRLAETKPISSLDIFFSQFKNSLIIVLMITGSLALAIGAMKEAIVIALTLSINVFFGFFQENKANQALKKLRSYSQHMSPVLRESQERLIKSTDLVLGDIIVLRAGNRVPADARVIESSGLEVNESSLTGESAPAKKNSATTAIGTALADRSNMIYSGTIITSGSGKALVTASGAQTELGKIADLIREDHEDRTPLQERLERFSKQLGAVFAAICFLIISLGLLQGRSFLEMIEIGIAVGVASIPEGLTVAITFVLALGMQNIFREKALVRRMVATETLGSTTVICTDKTGTLTKGEMYVDHIVIGEKEFEISDAGSRQEHGEARIVSLALQTAMMCNDASIENPDDALHEWRFIGTSTEIALLRAAIESGLRKEMTVKNEPKVAGLPFDSARKYMLSLHRHEDGSFVLYEKGAPERLIVKSTHFYHHGAQTVLSETEKKKLIATYESMTAKGLRVVGVAYRRFGHRENVLDLHEPDWAEIDKNLCFIGFIAIKDPLREEAKETIQSALAAGIRPIIITGDHRLTARAIAEELGLSAGRHEIISGEELEAMSDEKLDERLRHVSVFARVSPHHKLRIVKALQKNGEVVAMTGDGINDSPAIKAADIGISLGTGTDIAKETADLVLLDNNFKTIISAVRQGRAIYSNIKKIITYLVSISFTEIILISACIFLGLPLAILPVQILWVNIINGGLPIFSLAFETPDKRAMMKAPIKRDQALLSREMIHLIFSVGLLRDLVVLAVFLVMYSYWQHDPALVTRLQTLMFAIIGIKSLLSIFSLRHIKSQIWEYSPFSNPVLFISVIFSLLMLVLAIEWQPLQNILSTTSLGLNEWMIAFLVGGLGIAMTEFAKLRFRAQASKHK